MKNILVKWFFALGFIGSDAVGQEISDTQKRHVGDISETAGMPAIFRSPETGFGIGAVIIYTHNANVRRPSPIITGVMYSEKRQLLLASGTKQSFQDGKFALFGFASITKFPQKFYGIGNQTKLADEELYEEQRYLLDLGGEVNIYKSLSLGLSLHGQQDSNQKFEDAGRFARNEVPGKEGGHQKGLQAFLFWNTANDNFYPSSGNKITLGYLRYLAAWGSKYPFDGFRLDARNYYSLASETILASHVYLLDFNNQPPFYQLGQLGGNDLLRGYFKGRYRDRKLAIIQTEIRQNISKYWRFAVFGGFGNVAHDWQEFQYKDLKPSYGAGLRYQITTRQKLNLRFDVGIGDPSEGPQVYLYVMEAF